MLCLSFSGYNSKENVPFQSNQNQEEQTVVASFDGKKITVVIILQSMKMEWKMKTK
jgi:hypothetical protein